MESGRVWGFPKVRGTFLVVPMIRILGGLHWGPLILGKKLSCDSFDQVTKYFKSWGTRKIIATKCRVLNRALTQTKKK